MSRDFFILRIDSDIDHAVSVFFPLFLKGMNTRNWRLASYNFFRTFELLASGRVALGDLKIQAPPKKAGTRTLSLRKRAQLRLVGSDYSPPDLDGKKIEAHIRSLLKGISADSLLDKLFADLKNEKAVSTMDTASEIASVLSKKAEPSYNVISFPNRRLASPAPQ